MAWASKRTTRREWNDITGRRRDLVRHMSDPIVKLDLHGMTQNEAIKAIDKALDMAGPMTYQIRLIHGYNRGTSLRTMIYDWYRYEAKVKRIIPGDNPGITVLVLRELF